LRRREYFSNRELRETGLPGPHPGPPSDLHSRKLPIRQFEGELYPTYDMDRLPLFFGRSGTKRFDVSADSRLFAGDYDTAQLWSRALYECPLPRLDGIIYPARNDQTRTSIAIFDRAEGIELAEQHPWYDDREDEDSSLRPYREPYSITMASG
jgi:hypothetical protein